MMTPLPVRFAQELDGQPDEHRWLIEELWATEAVGIVGGEPQCCQSFLALAVAVAVASGAPCLRRFRPTRTGRVLLCPAEDALHVVRARLAGIARAAGVAFETLDIQVITAPTLRLDRPEDQDRLRETVSLLRPTLLVLDPVVRRHRIDENAAAEVAPVLAYLRELERQFHTAVLLVHHARKGAAHARAGQALRGSSELHAWGDSNLYLRRRGDALCLTIEHRAAPSRDGLLIELRAHGDALALEVIDHRPSDDRVFTPPPLALRARIEHALAEAATPLTRRALRRVCRIRASTLGPVLARLLAEGRVTRSPAGYHLGPSSRPFPDAVLPTLVGKRNRETLSGDSAGLPLSQLLTRSSPPPGLWEVWASLSDVQGPWAACRPRAGTFPRPSLATAGYRIARFLTSPPGHTSPPRHPIKVCDADAIRNPDHSQRDG